MPKRKLTITLDPDLINWLHELSVNEKRSISNMIEVLLTRIKEQKATE